MKNTESSRERSALESYLARHGGRDSDPTPRAADADFAYLGRFLALSYLPCIDADHRKEYGRNQGSLDHRSGQPVVPGSRREDPRFRLFALTGWTAIDRAGSYLAIFP